MWIVLDYGGVLLMAGCIGGLLLACMVSKYSKSCQVLR